MEPLVLAAVDVVADRCEETGLCVHQGDTERLLKLILADLMALEVPQYHERIAAWIEAHLKFHPVAVKWWKQQ